MVNPLQTFTVIGNQLGSLIELSWTLPNSLPQNYKVYVFKRSQTNVTDEEINDYFENIDDLTGFNYNGMFVFDQIPNDTLNIYDYYVRNGIKHYYRALVRDETAKEISAILSGNDTPDCIIETYVEDGKEIVEKVFEKLFDSLKDKSGNRIKVGKDIKIVRQFQIGKVEEDQVMLERINGNTQYNFWGNQFATNGQNHVLGEIDVDVIRATLLTIGGAKRRDTFTNILRGKKIWMQIMCKRLGAKQTAVVLEGDYWNPQFHGDNALGVTMVFSLLIENKLKIDYAEIDEHIAEFEEITTN